MANTPEQDFNDSSLMPFGKHKGTRLANIPASYLLYLYNEGCSHRLLRKYLNENLEVLRVEAAREKGGRR